MQTHRMIVGIYEVHRCVGLTYLKLDDRGLLLLLKGRIKWNVTTYTNNYILHGKLLVEGRGVNFNMHCD
jgi:hypothetical protein